MTRPGPTGRPAARSARAKCMTLRAKGPPLGPSPMGSSCNASGPGPAQAHVDLAQDLGGLAALDLEDVVLVLEERAQRVVDDGGRELERVEGGERPGPVQRLGHARQLEEVAAAQL